MTVGCHRTRAGYRLVLDERSWTWLQCASRHKHQEQEHHRHDGEPGRALVDGGIVMQAIMRISTAPAVRPAMIWQTRNTARTAADGSFAC